MLGDRGFCTQVFLHLCFGLPKQVKRVFKIIRLHNVKVTKQVTVYDY